MMKNIIEQKTVGEIQEQLKDFGSKRMRALKQLGDVSWVAKLMGCDEDIVTTAFKDASHEFDKMTNDGSQQDLVMTYVDGMNKCKNRLDKGTDAFDRMRKFINGVTNCYATATHHDKSNITDTDKMESIWMSKLIYDAVTGSQKKDGSKADTFTAQPKSKKPDTNTETLFTRWAKTFKTGGNTAELIQACTTEITMYICENISNENILGEICAYALGEDVENIVRPIAVLLSGSSDATQKVLTDTNGFALQFCELAKIVGCPDWMKTDNLTKPDTTQDSDKYIYKAPENIMMSILNDAFGGDVMKYLAG